MAIKDKVILDKLVYQDFFLLKLGSAGQDEAGRGSVSL